MTVKLIKEDGNVRGFTCKCGAQNRFPAYVYAHWRDSLTFTCICNRQYWIESGQVELDKSTEPAPQRVSKSRVSQ